MKPYTEIRLGGASREIKWGSVAGVIAAAILIAFCLPLLAGCDSESYEAQVREAERNAKVTRLCLPDDAQSFVTVKLENGEFIFRRYFTEPRKVSIVQTSLSEAD